MSSILVKYTKKEKVFNGPYIFFFGQKMYNMCIALFFFIEK